MPDELKVYIANGDGTYMQGIILERNMSLSAPMRQEYRLGESRGSFVQSRQQMEVTLTALITDQRMVLLPEELPEDLDDLDLNSGSVVRTMVDLAADQLEDKVNELVLSNELPERDLADIERLKTKLLNQLGVPKEYITPDRSDAVPPKPDPPKPASDLAKRFSALEVDDE